MLNINELKVGDVVGYKKFIRIGWSKNFRYPIVNEYTVTRITPKRTKIDITSSTGATITVEKSDFSNLCELTEQTLKESEIAKLYEETDLLRYKMEHSKSNYSTPAIELRDFEDEDIKKVHELVSYLYKKYVIKE